MRRSRPPSKQKGAAGEATPRRLSSEKNVPASGTPGKRARSVIDSRNGVLLIKVSEGPADSLRSRARLQTLELFSSVPSRVEVRPANKGRGTMTFSDNQNAPGANVPVPLAKIVRRAGMLYREICRQDGAAIYCAKGEGDRIEYEVFEVQVLQAGEFNGRSYPLREGFPSSSEWGQLGFTYTNNSHRDPLAVALAKAQEMASQSARILEREGGR
jgi:hypothetical protein